MFKNFRVGKRLPRTRASEEVTQRIIALESKLRPDGPVDHLVDGLLADAEQSVLGLEDQAWLLEKKARQLRRLAQEVHQRQVLSQLAQAIRGDDDEIDLFRAGLLIARLDNNEVDVAAYQKELAQLAREIKQRFPKHATDKQRLAELNKFLFEESGFHGSRTSYYNRSNSYLNEVLDDREGLPVTLSVLYIELARRCGLRIEGVGLPGHFVVRHVSMQVDASQIGQEPAPEAGQLIDVFDRGKPLTRQQAASLVLSTAGAKLDDEHLEPVTKRAIVLRMLGNLLGLARRDQDAERMLRYLDAVLVVAPEAGGERWVRAVLRYETHRLTGAKADTAWLLEHHPPGVNTEDVHNLRRLIEEQE